MRLSALSDLVRTLAIASASGTYRQEDGELIGTRVFHQAVIRPRLRSDAQPVLPLGEWRDLMMISLLVLRTMRETFTGVAPSSSLVK